MFVHEYSDEKFNTYEKCADDLFPKIEAEDIAHHLDLTVPDIVARFLRKSEDDFLNWFAELVNDATNCAVEELITEYEEEEVD